MTISLSLAWALFVLAPGLATYAGLFMAKQADVVHPAAPAPNSFMALAVVIFGALASHALGSSFLALNDLYVLCVGPVFETRWTPNVYAYFLGNPREADPDLGIETALLLLNLGVLSIIAYGLTARVSGQASAGSGFHTFLYGWLSPVLAQMNPEPGGLKHLIAYVVTDIEAPKALVGYEGQVENLSLNADKQIVSLTLRNCRSFYLNADGKTIGHSVIARELPIPRLQLDQSQIKNIALSVVFEETTEADTDDSVENANR